MTGLGQMYAIGVAVPKDDAEAVRWFRQAAEKGDAYGIFSLGMSYDAGEGVPKDAEEAARLVFSAVQEDKRLIDTLKLIGGLWLSPEGCQALQRRLRDADVFSEPVDGQCGPAVMKAFDRLRERATAPR